MTITDAWADTVELHDIENLLPAGFAMSLTDPSGGLTDNLKSGTPE